MADAKRPKLLGVIFDSSEAVVIEAGIAEGWLPNLAALRAEGSYGRISSVGSQINAAPWPTFVTGRKPGDHGVWNFVGWDPQKMDHAECRPDKEDFEPFWRALCREGCRSVVLDVPRTYAPTEPFDGVEFSAWASHYKLVKPYSHPPEFLEWVNREVGTSPLGSEPGGDLTAAMILQERDVILKATRMQGDVAVKAIERESAELFLLALSGPHRGGHMLWDCSGLAVTPTDEERTMIGGAIREIYIEADRQLGRVLEALGPRDGTTVWALSLHGMERNSSLAPCLPEMLDRVLNDRKPEPETEAEEGSSSLTSKLREAVPLSVRTSIKNRLPTPLQNWLTRYWRRPNVDWSVTPAVALLDDLQGFIRINLKGRERDGIVEPGAEYDALCEKIAAGLKTFKHVDTGEPAVLSVERMDAVYPGGERVGMMPDLIVHWSQRPVADVSAIESEQFGRVDWPTPGRIGDGRSGHHNDRGWWLAAGPGITPGSSHENAEQYDILPTLFATLGREKPAKIEGKVHDALMPDVVGSA